jgi:hypothetical protein
MLTKSIALATLFAAGLSVPALAQTAAPAPTTGTAVAPAAQLDDLDADRINANQITIDFEYTGGACEEVGPAVVGEETNGVLAVTFPIVATAEVCTQQAVEIDVEQAVTAPATVTRVDVTLTRPDGSVLASGSTDVDND